MPSASGTRAWRRSFTTPTLKPSHEPRGAGLGHDRPGGPAPDPHALAAFGAEVHDMDRGIDPEGVAEEAPGRRLPGHRGSEEEEPGMMLVLVGVLTVDARGEGQLEHGAAEWRRNLT